MSKTIGWVTAFGAALAFALAMLLWGVGPASECSTPHEVHRWAGFLPFTFFIAAGAFTAARGTAAQRLLLFVTSAVTVAAYVWVLSFSLPMVIETEIGCAATAQR
jgi:hypothetical protein